MARSEALGIQRLEDILFVVNDIERSTRFYVDKLDFALTARSTPDNEAATGERTRVFEAGEVRVTVVQPLTPTREPVGRPLVAVDAVGAGVGEEVFFVRGKEASFPFYPVEAPVDAGIVGIVDHLYTE